MMGRGGGLRSTLCISLIFCLSLATIIVGTYGQTDVTNCAANTLPPSNQSVTVSAEGCFTVPVASSTYTYTIWAERTNSTNGTTLSVILSVPLTSGQNRWYGMGFNKAQSQMIGTEAIIFWQNQTVSGGPPVVNTYYLTAEAASGVNPDTTRLKFNVAPHVESTSSALILSFELDNADDDSFTYQNFVVGVDNNVPTGEDISSNIVQHEGESSVFINFRTNQIVATSNDKDKKARTHGILNIVGWGVLLPLGAIVARYGKAFDPHWFYTHAALQIIGFAVVLGGLITGLKLEDDFPSVDVDTHKALAILVFVLACIQLTAGLIRPNKEAKLRRYWNWGHWWVGRAALVIAAVNIFVGIHLANASKKWKIGYGFALAVEILLVVVLETWLWVTYARSKKEPRLPQTAMQNRNGSAATAPPVYDSTNWDDKQ